MEAVISTVSVASDSVVVTVRIGQSTAAHSVPLILAQIIKQSMNNDLLHSMYLTQSLRVDEIHQVHVSTIEQEIFHIIFRFVLTLLVLNLRCSCISIQAKEEVAHILRYLALR